uniref:Uncharacterized protein n=1 Tax=viral metagenome TaxID=1070528 RepID=A0A6C0JJV5_9ZZZZ
MYGIKDLLDYMPTPFYFKTDEIKDYLIRTRDNILTNLLFFYSNGKTDFDEKCKHINKNYFVHFLTSHLSYSYDYIYSKIINKRIEPMQSYWIASYVLSRRDRNRLAGEEYTMFESYEFVKDPLHNVSNIEISFNEICDALDSVVLNSPSYIEGMVKMKIGDDYVFRIFDNNNGHFTDFKDPPVPSKARFLNVEYTHPLMNRSIEFFLDKDVYFVDNQILSPTFVKLCLESQSEPYHFDMDYVIKIMDDNITWFDLKFDKSILLTEDGYLLV